MCYSSCSLWTYIIFYKQGGLKGWREKRVQVVKLCVWIGIMFLSITTFSTEWGDTGFLSATLSKGLTEPLGSC